MTGEGLKCGGNSYMGTAHLVQRFFAELGHPFASWSDFRFALSGGIHAFTTISSKTGWPYMLSGLLISWIIYWRTRAVHGQRNFLRFLFPKEIYQHPSAIADYKFAAFELSSRLLFTAPFISSVSYALYKLLHQSLPTIPFHRIGNPVARGVLVTVASVLFADFVFFASHYLMHKIPVLWQFHEVHHSAEVLTPITVYRVHPVEDLVTAIVGALVGAFIGIFYTGTLEREPGIITIFGVNIIVLFFFLFGNVLRHSHVWLSYGPFWSHLLISPAQHQVHHSSETRHWDKNFGYIFAFWDFFCRTLYVPKEREQLIFGVPGVDSKEYSTLGRLYLLPFVKAARLCARTVRSRKERVFPYSAPAPEYNLEVSKRT